MKRHRHGGEHERPRRVTAGVAGDRADQHIDAGADGDADAIQHQQRQPEPAAQRDRQLDRRLVVHGGTLAAQRMGRLARHQAWGGEPAAGESSTFAPDANALIVCNLPGFFRSYPQDRRRLTILLGKNSSTAARCLARNPPRSTVCVRPAARPWNAAAAAAASDGEPTAALRKRRRGFGASFTSSWPGGRHAGKADEDRIVEVDDRGARRRAPVRTCAPCSMASLVGAILLMILIGGGHAPPTSAA